MPLKHISPGLLALSAATSLLAIGASAADKPALKDTYKNDFYVGVAINRAIATDDSVRADNVNRNREQVDKDIALVKEQFNQFYVMGNSVGIARKYYVREVTKEWMEKFWALKPTP